MLRIFYGDDRVRATKEIKKLLQPSYESIEGADLTINDLPNIFLGASLFEESRNILIRDFCANKTVFSELPKYLNTPHSIILLESKLDKRSTTYKELKDKIEVKEFTLPEPADFRLVFDIYKTAKRDGEQAIKLLRKIKINEDPIQFTGLMISSAIKDFSAHPTGARERKILKELSHLDLNMKSTKIDPWLLVESFLLRLSNL